MEMIGLMQGSEGDCGGFDQRAPELDVELESFLARSNFGPKKEGEEGVSVAVDQDRKNILVVVAAVGSLVIVFVELV